MAAESATTVHAPNAALFAPSQIEQTLMLRALDDPYASAALFAAEARGNRMRDDYRDALGSSNAIARALAERKLAVDLMDKQQGHAINAVKVGSETGSLPYMNSMDVLKGLFSGANPNMANQLGALGQAKTASEVFKNVIDPAAAANREGVIIDPQMTALRALIPGAIQLGDPAQVRSAGIGANANNEPKIKITETPLGGTQVDVTGRVGALNQDHVNYAKSLINPARNAGAQHNGGSTPVSTPTPKTPTQPSQAQVIQQLEQRNPGFKATHTGKFSDGRSAVVLTNPQTGKQRWVDPTSGQFVEK